MKKTLVTAAVLAAICSAPAAFAAEGKDVGTLTINGLIKGTTCHFDSSAHSAEITMHQIGTSAFEGLNPGNAYHNYQNKTTTPFKIYCDAGAGVPKLKFLGSDFEVTGASSVTKNTNEETKNGGYALLMNGQRVNTDGSTPVAATPSANGEYQFDISAMYARAAAGQVNGGAVNSVVTFTVVAD